MKKLLLLFSAAAFCCNIASAQFLRNPGSGTSTGMSFSGSVVSDANGEWSAYTPTYSDAGCGTYASMYLGGGGATSGSPASGTNEVDYTFVNVSNGYDNFGTGTCYPNIPSSFSFNTVSTTSLLDLTNTADRILTISIKTTMSFAIDLLLQEIPANGYAAILSKPNAIVVNGDGVYHTYTVDFSSATATAAINSVYNIALVYNNTTPIGGTGTHLYVNNMAIGSSTVTALSKISSIESSKLFPNPASDVANIELNLQSVSDLKVTLNDMLGREVASKTATASSMSDKFDVSALPKGAYIINYYINGAPAKGELLMVK
jgi:hypothetical protein